jgi:hypothetical protein
LPRVANAQLQPWITSISYQQNKSGTSTTLDVHVGLLQPGSTGYPCVGSSLILDAPLFHNADVTSIDGTADENDQHLIPSPEPSGLIYHIPVGMGKDLPVGWESVTLRLSAHCADSKSASPIAFVVRRYASTSVLEVDADQPRWNHSVKEDTLSLVIKSNWPTSIHNLVIRDDGADPGTRGNSVTQPYDDKVDSFIHNITMKTIVPLKGSGRYKYEVQFQSGEVSVVPLKPLPAFTLSEVPTEDFVLVPPKPDELIVKDNTKDFKFSAQTNANGTLSVVFDNLKVNGLGTLRSSADGATYTFTIPKENLQADGQYSFHFEGSREFPKQTLADRHPSILIIAAHPKLNGPIGLGLSKNNDNILVTYCLSQQSSNLVRITNDPHSFSVEGTGNPIRDDVGCKDGVFAYSAAIPLANFKGRVPEPTPNQMATARSGASSGGSTPPQLPLQLYIVDTSSKDNILATFNISAVLLPSNSDTKGLVDALGKLQDKNQKDAATKILKETYGLDQSTIDSLAQIGKKSNGAASTIGTLLGTVGKSFVSAYFGIPAAPASPTASK